MCLPKELYLVLPKRPGLIFRQHAEVSSFHVHIHRLTERNRKDSLISFSRCLTRSSHIFVLRDHQAKFIPIFSGLSCVLYLGPAALLAQKVCIEVRHLPCLLIGEAPHQLPVAHVVELLPRLLGLAAIFKECHRLVAQ